MSGTPGRFRVSGDDSGLRFGVLQGLQGFDKDSTDFLRVQDLLSLFRERDEERSDKHSPHQCPLTQATDHPISAYSGPMHSFTSDPKTVLSSGLLVEGFHQQGSHVRFTKALSSKNPNPE